MLEIPLIFLVGILGSSCFIIKKQLNELKAIKSTIVFVDNEGNKRHVSLFNYFCPNQNCKLHGKKAKGNINKRKIYGKYKDRLWLKCTSCNYEFSETRNTAYFNKKKPIKLIVKITKYLSEGGEIRKASRIFKVSKDTVLSYLKSASIKAKLVNKLHDNMKFRFFQLDELWSFILKKDKNLIDGEEVKKGSFYGFISFAFKHRFIINIHNGKRNDEETNKFILKLKKYIDLKQNVLIMSDGFSSYLTSLLKVFGVLSNFYLTKDNEPMIVLHDKINYGQIIKKKKNGRIEKIETNIISKNKNQFKRILKLVGCKKITTSLIERLNLTLRHSVGRFSRKGMGFSKNITNHKMSLEFFQAVYNYVKPHRSLGKNKTPAMSIGITNQRWTIDDILRYQPINSY